MTNKLKNLSFLISMILLVSSCAKDGDTGPQGAQGPAGADGNANIKSFQFTVTPGDWQTVGTPGTAAHLKFYEKTIPEITSDIMSNGMVTCYMVSGGYNVALPLALPMTSTDFENFFYGFTVGTLEVDVNWSNLTTPNMTEDFEFRAVVADGTVRVMNPDLDWKNYDAVAKRFNLVIE